MPSGSDRFFGQFNKGSSLRGGFLCGAALLILGMALWGCPLLGSAAPQDAGAAAEETAEAPAAAAGQTPQAPATSAGQTAQAPAAPAGQTAQTPADAGVAAPPTPAFTELSRVYDLKPEALTELLDPSESTNAAASEQGIHQQDSAAVAVYITKPIEMPEFTKLTLSWQCENTEKDYGPAVAVSVWKRSEGRYSDWIPLSPGETAKRYKEDFPTVLVRFRIELPPAAAGEPLLFSQLIVSAGEHMFTKENLTILTVVLGAYALYLYRKKKYGADIFRRKKS